jgi:hypothetical protein
MAIWLLDDLHAERFAFPYIGSRPVSALKAAHLLSVLRRLEAHGKIETTGRAERHATSDLRGALGIPAERMKICAQMAVVLLRL